MAPALIAAIRRASWGRRLELVVGLVFIGAGCIKLGGLPVMVRLFAAIGMGQWLRYVVGASELLGGVLLLGDATALVGALLLCGVIAGAIGSNVLILHDSPLVPSLMLVALLVVVWERRRDAAALARTLLHPLAAIRRGRVL